MTDAGAPPSQPDGDQGGFDLGSAPEAKAYRVLARKYRPASFEDLIGQDAVVRTVSNAFETGRIPQAWILTGVRGVGKTTTARILALALNYELPDGSVKRPTIHMPTLGVHCRAIMESRHMDVLEMDAASHTGVDDVRAINDSVRYAPASARYKVYIIDEVHMLSTAAFNAFLKTLEEPPEHAKFVFATTEIRKVPVTVLSRCQRFDLRRVEADVLMRHLSRIAAKEKVEIEPEALGIIARAAEGSVRDSLSLLDQAIAHAAGSVRAEQVRQMLLKGITEAQGATRPAAAAEMVLVRIAYVADMPTPDEAIRMIEQNGGASPVIASSPAPRSAAASPVSSMTTSPARAAAAPRTEASARPQTIASAVEAPSAPALRINTFPELVALAASQRDLLIKGALETDVRLVRIEDGRLEVALERSAARALVNELSRKLELWTGRRWTVIVSNEAGQPTLREQSLVEKSQRERAAEADPRVKEVLARFPGAKVIEVRKLAAEPPESDGSGGDDGFTEEPPDDNDL